MNTLRTAAVSLLLAPLLLASLTASAQPKRGPKSATPPPPAAPVPSEAPPPSEEALKKAEAREHFEKGVLLFDDEAWDAALAEFLRSREVFPTRAATKNAAICLRKLHRFDEALDMFEELLKFPELPQGDRELGDKEVKALRGLVGEIEIQGGEPGATVTVDGRERGSIPSPPLRVAAGAHVVRLYKKGYTPFEARLDVAGGQRAAAKARMAALVRSGTLKVVEQGGREVDVVVDNAVVGKTPWEGPLAPGDHTVSLRGEGSLGTQPATTPVRLNEVASLTLAVEELAAALRVEPTPVGALVAVDGVSVGRGVWSGRLRAGAHTIEVVAEGFLPTSARVALRDGDKKTLPVSLTRDPESPLWGRKRARFLVEVYGGFALAPSFGGDVAGACDGACDRGLGLGFLAVGRGAYELSSGFGFGIDAGYVRLRQRVTNRQTTTQPRGLAANAGAVDDTLTLGGLLLGGAAGLRLGDRFPLTMRLGVGALLGSVEDARRGTFRTVPRPAHDTADPYDVDVAQSASTVSLYLAPEVRAGIRFADRFEASLGVQATVLFVLSQPTWDPELSPVSTAGDGEATFASGALLGRTVLALTPGISLRYAF